MPTDLREWLPADHLGWFVLDTVSEPDLEPFYRAYRADGWGRAAHDPQMMVALCLYAYATGERSARRIERRCSEDDAYRVISANRAPDHATIARFRARATPSSSPSSSARSSASAPGPAWSRSARSPSTAPESWPTPPTRPIAAISSQPPRSSRRRPGSTPRRPSASAIAAATSCRRSSPTPPPGGSACARRSAGWTRSTRPRWRRWPPGSEPRPNTPPALASNEKGAPLKPRPIRQEGEGEDQPPRDPDSRPVKTTHGLEFQGYTAQAVTTEGQIVVAAEAISGANERRSPGADGKGGRGRALKRAGIEERLSAATTNARLLERPPDRGARGERDEGPGPARRRHPQGAEQDQTGRPLPADARALSRDPRPAALYRRRQQMIEPVFAQIKNNLRAGRFSRRGLASCRAEWRLTAATHNLMKLYRSGLAPAGPEEPWNRSEAVPRNRFSSAVPTNLARHPPCKAAV